MMKTLYKTIRCLNYLYFSYSAGIEIICSQWSILKKKRHDVKRVLLNTIHKIRTNWTLSLNELIHNHCYKFHVSYLFEMLFYFKQHEFIMVIGRQTFDCSWTTTSEGHIYIRIKYKTSWHPAQARKLKLYT